MVPRPYPAIGKIVLISGTTLIGYKLDIGLYKRDNIQLSTRHFSFGNIRAISENCTNQGSNLYTGATTAIYSRIS